MASLYSKTSVFVRPHLNREASVFRKFHSGEPFVEHAFSVTVSAEYVSTVGQTGEKNLRFQTKTGQKLVDGAMVNFIKKDMHKQIH